MLRDVALRSAYRIDDVLHADLVVAEHAQNLQAQRMGDCLERARGGFYVLVLVDEREDVVFVHDRADGAKR